MGLSLLFSLGSEQADDARRADGDARRTTAAGGDLWRSSDDRNFIAHRLRARLIMPAAARPPPPISEAASLFGVLVVALASGAAAIPDALKAAGQWRQAWLARIFRGDKSEVLARSARAVCRPEPARFKTRNRGPVHEVNRLAPLGRPRRRRAHLRAIAASRVPRGQPGGSALLGNQPNAPAPLQSQQGPNQGDAHRQNESPHQRRPTHASVRAIGTRFQKMIEPVATFSSIESRNEGCCRSRKSRPARTWGSTARSWRGWAQAVMACRLERDRMRVAVRRSAIACWWTVVRLQQAPSAGGVSGSSARKQDAQPAVAHKPSLRTRAMQRNAVVGAHEQRIAGGQIPRPCAGVDERPQFTQMPAIVVDGCVAPAS